MKHPKRILTGLLLAGSTSLALAACASGAVDGSAVSAEKAGDLATVRVGIFPSSMNAVFAYGEEKGLFEKHGIDIETTMGQGSAALLPSLDSGKLDLAVASTITPLVSQAHGMTLPIVSTFTADEGVPGSTAVLLVGKGSEIQDVCGLKGKTISVNALGSIGDTLISEDYAMHDCGDPAKDITFIQLGFPDVPAQLASGQIDAGMAPSPFVQLVEADGGRQLADFVMDTGVAKMELSVIANEDFAREKSDTVVAFVAALTEAGEAANVDPDGVRAVLPEALGSDEQAARAAVFETWTTAVDRPTIERWAELAEKYGLVDAAPDVDAVIWQK